MDRTEEDVSSPVVGIAVLNYRHPEETLACVRRLLEREPASSRVVWIENDAATAREDALRVLRDSGLRWSELRADSAWLPSTGCLGVIFNEENLGYAAGNNVALRLFARLGVPYAWVLNNDTLLASGSSRELRAAAESRPEVGVWGAHIFNDTERYVGGLISAIDYATDFAETAEVLEADPLSFASGCSLFFRLDVAAKIGFLPEEYFLYYEDPAFSFELRRIGYTISAVASVRVEHAGSLSTGRRSALMEFYCRRNRWYFIEKYFPRALSRQKQMIWYNLQKWLLRGKFARMGVEMAAYRDYRKGRMGKTDRDLSPRRRI